MSIPEPKRYKIGEVILGEDGEYWFEYLGVHPDQGGLSFRWGSIGTDLPSLGRLIVQVLTRNEEGLKAAIAKKASNPDKS